MIALNGAIDVARDGVMMITLNGVIDVARDKIMMITLNRVIGVARDEVMMTVALGALINVALVVVISVILTIVIILDRNKDLHVDQDEVLRILVLILMKVIENPVVTKVPVVATTMRANLNKKLNNQLGVPVAECGQKTQILATHLPDAQYAEDLNLQEVQVLTLLHLAG